MDRTEPFCNNCSHPLSDHGGGGCTRCDYNILKIHNERHPDTTLEKCECYCCEDLQNCTQFIEVEDE